MSSSHITLKEFVRAVPTCQQEVTLETLLALVRSSQQTTIVLVDRLQKPIAVLDYRRLLLLVAEHLLPRFTPSVSLDRVSGAAAPATRDRPGIFTQNLDLNSLKEPIVTLSSQMRVEEFLSYLKARGKTNESSQHYILVDVEGKLLGLLDVPCLLETLLWNWQNTDTQPSQNQPCNHWFFELLEQTPLPLMLQATEGQTLYQNRYWQEQVNQIKEFNQSENTAISLSQRQQKHQLSFLSDGNWQPESKLYPYCLKGNYGLTSTFASLSQPTITAQSLEILSSLTSEVSGDRSRVERENQNSSSESDISLTAPTTINSQNIWQYTKLPIDCTDYQCLPTNCSPKCWLILATPNCQTRQFSREEAAKDAELSELNRWKDEFLASISHELKSPLTAIVGLSSLLKEQKLGTLNQRQLRYTELIYRSGRQLMNIVNDLLDWSRLATGKLELNLEPVKIKAICEEVYQQVLAADRANNISSSKHRFKLNIEAGLETIVADRLRLCQILTHLLENAFKFIASEGEVGISVSLWTQWVAITVWNTGREIPELFQPLVLEQIFPPETSSVERDEGLGLVLAQQLARAHGGDISFISRVGKGSEFTLLLPYRKKNYTQNWQSQTTATPTDESICAHRSAPRQNNSLILIAEAVPHHIDNLANQLEELGYHPIIARTGTETLYKARQFKPSKILLNSSFSLLSGDDILTLLQSDPRTANIPVWLTAEEKQKQEQKGDLEEICFADRVDGLLSLPIDKQILAQVLSSRKEQSSSENKSLTILRLYPGADAVRQHPQSGIANQPATTKNSSGDFGLNNDGAYKPRGCLRRKPPELESPVRPSRARSAPHLYSLHHRVIEADSLEQGEILARIWQLDVILLDGSLLPEPLQYLHTLREYELLAALPLVTLDAKTTEAANQVDGLSVFPCLVPADQRSLADLVQVIQIAAGIMNQVTSER